MSNKITIKRSAVPGKIPQPGDLEFGEFAINYADGNLFFKDSSNTVATLASTQFVSVTGNVTGGNIVTLGTVSAAGNVAGNYFIGNGAFLTGIVGGSGMLVGTVDDFTGDGSTVAFTLSVTPTSENVTSVNISGVSQLKTAYSITSDVITFSSAPAAGAAIEVTTLSGSVMSVGNIANGTSTVAIPVENGNVIMTVGSSSNVFVVTDSGANTTGSLSATGNITGNYFIGNGSQLTGLPEGYGNADVAAYLPTYTGNLASLTGAVNTSGNITVGGTIGIGTDPGIPAISANGKLLVGDSITNANISNVVNYANSAGTAAYRPINLVDTSAVIKVARLDNGTNGPSIELQQWDTDISNLASRWDLYTTTAGLGIRKLTSPARDAIVVDNEARVLIGSNASITTTSANLMANVANLNLQVLGSAYVSANVGIGTANISAPLTVAFTSGTPIANLMTTDAAIITANATAPGFAFVVAGSSSGHRGVFKGTRARGTLESPEVPQQNDAVMTMLGAIYDSETTRATAGIEFTVDGTVSAGVAPQRIALLTGETNSRTERMSIYGNGVVNVRTTTASTSSDSGALIVSGGMGVVGNVNTGGSLTVVANVTGGNLVTAGLTNTGTLQTSGNAIIGGNLVVNGNTVNVNITDLNVQDPVIGLGRGANNAPLTVNDGKDRGTQLWYYNTAERSAFMGYDNSVGKMIAASNVSIANEIVTVNSYGSFVTGAVEAATVSATGNITGGNVSATTGAFTTVTGNANATSLTSGTVPSARLSGSYTINISGAATSATTASTVTTAAQPNITSVGTLSSLSVTGNITAGNLLGTIRTAAQTNITSVGTLGALSVTGNITSNNIAVGDRLTFTGSTDYIAPTTTVESWYYESDFSVAAQDTEPRSVTFSADGTRMFVAGNAGDDVIQYNLGTAWSVSTAVFDSVFVVSAQEATITGVTFKPDGTVMYIVGQSSDSVHAYNLGTPWTVTTAVFANTFSVAAQETAPGAVEFSSDGTKMYVMGDSGDDINQYNLGTAWNITTAVYSTAFSVSLYENVPQGLAFNADGTKMWVVGSTYARLVEYTLSTPWSIATAVFSDLVVVGNLGNYALSGISGLYVNLAQNKAYISDYGNDRIFQLKTNLPATKLYGSKWVVQPDLTLESDLIVDRNVRVNGNFVTPGTVQAGTVNASTLNISSAIDLADNDILRFGSGDDWEFFHNGTDNYMDLNVGNLIIRDNTTTRFTFGRTTGNLTAANFLGVASSAKYADLAEIYASDADYPAGTVVVFGGDQEITVSTEYAQTSVAGVVSTNPAYLMNSAADGQPVALQGRVPCRVVGNIRKGDLLTSSTTPGVATRLDPADWRPGAVIGKALANYNSNTEGVIEAVVGRV